MITGAYKLPDRFISGTFDGMVFGREDSAALYKVFRWDGWFGSPGVRADKTDRLWGHGTFSDRGWRDARLIIIEGNAHFDTEQAALEGYNRLMAAGAEGTYHTLTVEDSLFGTLTATVRLANEVVVDWLMPGVLSYQLQLLSPDPRKYGPAIRESTGVAVAGDGLQWDLFTTGPGLDFGNPGDPGTVTITNPGTADTSQRFTLTGSAPNGFTIRYIPTDAVLQYSTPLALGETLVLNSSDGTAQLNGYADRAAKLTRRDWVRLGKGQTGVWLLDAPGSTNLRMEVEVLPAWW